MGNKIGTKSSNKNKIVNKKVNLAGQGCTEKAPRMINISQRRPLAGHGRPLPPMPSHGWPWPLLKSQTRLKSQTHLKFQSCLTSAAIVRIWGGKWLRQYMRDSVFKNWKHFWVMDPWWSAAENSEQTCGGITLNEKTTTGTEKNHGRSRFARTLLMQ